MIKNNRLSSQQYAENFSDIHPPFENKAAALVEANRCRARCTARAAGSSQVSARSTRRRQSLASSHGEVAAACDHPSDQGGEQGSPGDEG